MQVRRNRCGSGEAASCFELAAAELVDGLNLGLTPILLGGGIPMLPTPASRLPLRLRAHQVYPKTGTLFLEYDVVPGRKSRGPFGA